MTSKNLDEAGAVLCSTLLTTDIQRIYDREGKKSLIVSYQKSLNIYVTDPTTTKARGSEAFPEWAVHAVVGLLSGHGLRGRLNFSVVVLLNRLAKEETARKAAGSAAGYRSRSRNLRNVPPLPHGTRERVEFLCFGAPQTVPVRQRRRQAACSRYTGQDCGHCAPVPAMACMDQPRSTLFALQDDLRRCGQGLPTCKRECRQNLPLARFLFDTTGPKYRPWHEPGPLVVLKVVLCLL